MIDAIQQGKNSHQAIVLAPKMCWRAGPSPIDSGRSQFRFDGIQSHLAESSAKAIAGWRATVLCSTSTFLRLCVRNREFQERYI